MYIYTRMYIYVCKEDAARDRRIPRRWRDIWAGRMEIKESVGTARIRKQAQALHPLESPKKRPGGSLGVLRA